MSNRVTVRGSRTPCVDLPTGEIRVCELTEQTRRRIAMGYYDLVEGSLDGDPDVEPEKSDARDNQNDAHDDGAPAGNASREEWAAFMTEQGFNVAADAGRDALRDEWRHVQQQVHGGG